MSRRPASVLLGLLILWGAASTAPSGADEPPGSRAGDANRSVASPDVAAHGKIAAAPEIAPASEIAATPAPETAAGAPGTAAAPQTATSPALDGGQGTAATDLADHAAPTPTCSDPATRALALRCFPRLLVEDARAVLGAPAHWRGRQWGIFSLEVLGVGAVTVVDRRVLRGRGAAKFEDHVARDFEPLGSWASFAVIGALYAGGAVAGDDKARGAALDSLAASAIAAGVVTPALKEILGRSRPNQRRGKYNFRPFSGDASFPSGHATQAFAVASVIATDYPRLWVQVAAYLPAALVGFARLRQDAHFTSDVVAGALIGIGVGRAVARVNRSLRSGKASARLVPLITPTARGLMLITTF